MSVDSSKRKYVIIFAQGSPGEVATTLSKIPETSSAELPFELYDKILDMVLDYILNQRPKQY